MSDDPTGRLRRLGDVALWNAQLARDPDTRAQWEQLADAWMELIKLRAEVVVRPVDRTPIAPASGPAAKGGS